MTPNSSGNTSGLFYEAAPSTWNQLAGDPNAGWCDDTTNTLGVSSNLFGTGAMDGPFKTTTMLAVCGSGAAVLADAYSVTIDGVTYADWFLPSKGELNQMYLNRAAIGGFRNGLYWSSSEHSSALALYQNFSNGLQGYDGVKSDLLYIRPVRAF